MKLLLPLLSAFLLFSAFTFSCDKEEKAYSRESIRRAAQPNGIRVLAAQCYQCHGTHGISVTKWDSIAGEELEELFEVKHPLMKAQLKGYTREELVAIMKYLARFKKKEEREEHDDD
ncbi:c-type cytochrome [Thermovibrio ammonificans]